MKFNELKEAYFELKRTENAKKMPLIKTERAILKMKLTELTNLLHKYETIFFVNAKELKQAFDEYFETKNAKANVGYFYKRTEHTTKDFYGEETYHNYYTYIKINVNDEEFSTNIYAKYPKSIMNFSELDFYTLNFKIYILDIMNAFFDSEEFAELYENFDDILDMLWNLVLENVKNLKQEKINKLTVQQEAKRNLIAELTDQKIIAKKVATLESEISALETKKET